VIEEVTEVIVGGRRRLPGRPVLRYAKEEETIFLKLTAVNQAVHISFQQRD